MMFYNISIPNLKFILKFLFIKYDNINKTERINKRNILLILLVYVFLFFLLHIFQGIQLYLVSNIIAVILQFLICLPLLIICISNCINKNNKSSKVYYSLVNILFIITPIMFIKVFSIFDKIYFLLLNHIILLLMIFCLYKLVEIKDGSDFSELKAMNLFLAAIFTAIVSFPIVNINNENIKDILKYIQIIIGYYYIVPLMMLQGLYELLGKSK